MKPYGIRPRDYGCCPGHDKFTRVRNPTHASAVAFRANNKVLHRNGRARDKAEVARLVREVE